MRRYTIPVIFEISIKFSTMRLHSQLRDGMRNTSGLTIGTVDSTLPADQVEWSFFCHPTKKAGKGVFVKSNIDADQEQFEETKDYVL